MADCRHIANSEIAISQRESSAFDEIWYINADLELVTVTTTCPNVNFLKIISAMQQLYPRSTEPFLSASLYFSKRGAY